MTDIIHEVLSRLQRDLEVEREWVTLRDGGFEWWPGPLAQRLWVEEGEPHRLHIETDLLRNVSFTDTHLMMVSHGNIFATFSALVLSPDDRRLRLHASVCLPSGGASEAMRLASLVATMQAAGADCKPSPRRPAAAGRRRSAAQSARLAEAPDAGTVPIGSTSPSYTRRRDSVRAS